MRVSGEMRLLRAGDRSEFIQSKGDVRLFEQFAVLCAPVFGLRASAELHIK